jgi:phospholipid-binding lipoprotein MlaA
MTSPPPTRAARRGAASLALATALLALSACATRPPRGEWDPVEPVNRGFFAFNDGLDRVVVEPLARGWAFVLRPAGTRAVDRLFTNLEFPIRFVGNVLQARPLAAGEEVGRFLVNTTAGIVGLFDPASSLGLGLYDEDIGQAVAVWGVAEGPYLMAPLLGPATTRDFVTGFADSALLGPASIARSTVGMLNTRALLLDDVRQARAAALDYYALVRNGYLSIRRAQVEDRSPTDSQTEIPDDFYDIDDEEE